MCTRSGTLIYADPDSGDVLDAIEVCANPRGLLLDDEATAWVACAEGEVLGVRHGQIAERIEVGVELRDVVDVGPPLRVSTFRTPSILTLDASGGIQDVEAPSVVGVIEDRETVPLESSPDPELVGPLILNVARRAVSEGDGRWQMLHQIARQQQDGTAETGWATGNGCVGNQNAAVSWVDGDSPEVHTEVFPGMSAAFDAAFDVERERFTVVGATESGWVVVTREPIDGLPTVVQECTVLGQRSLSAMPTAVEFDTQGRAWVFAPEEPELVIFDPDASGGPERVHFIEEQSVLDSGFEDFHRPTPGNIACVSCHPEGREDGLRCRPPRIKIQRRSPRERRRSSTLGAAAATSRHATTTPPAWSCPSMACCRSPR